jgi:DNA-binding response OmpR family regulator
MKRLLLIDDDAVLLRAYRDRLSAHGFRVQTAASGTGALAILNTAQPDLIVLDLMMPDMSGVQVLSFIRSQPKLAATPVVILTNAYLNDLGKQAAAIGIERALLKSQCSPTVLMGVIDELLQPKTSEPEPPPTAPAPEPPPAPEAVSDQPAPAASLDETAATPKGGLLAQGPAISAEIRKLFQAVARSATDPQTRQTPLKELYHKVHVLAAAASREELPDLAQIAAVFEALLYVLVENPSRTNASVLRTLASLVDFVESLFQRAQRTPSMPCPTAQVLAVDDDPLANRLVLAALREAKLDARALEDPLKAWELLQDTHFDLVLLDIEMPGLNGLDLCKRLRLLPGYAKTPIVLLTIHSDFESRARGTLSGANDLITKPVLSMELAAKVVMHLVKARIAA